MGTSYATTTTTIIIIVLMTFCYLEVFMKYFMGLTDAKYKLYTFVLTKDLFKEAQIWEIYFIYNPENSCNLVYSM